MSYDTNLHRTFDYQLSPAPLRIIDWAPVRSVARSVLQTGQGAKALTLVDDASANMPHVALAYVKQENKRRAHVSHGPSASLAPAAAANDLAAAEGPLSAIGEPTASQHLRLSAASPYYTPGMNGGTAAAARGSGGGHSELYALKVNDTVPQQQQQPQSDAWGAAPGEPAGGAGTGGTAALSAALAHTVGLSTEATSVVAAPATAALASGGSSSGMAAPAAMAGSAQRSRALSSPSTAPPLLVKSASKYGAAGIMYGFDSVYRRESFGVLMGLLTGAGYHQMNTYYRQEQPALPRRMEPAMGEHRSRSGTSPVGVVTALPAPRSSSTANFATNRSAAEQEPCSLADTVMAVGAADSQAAEGSLQTSPPTLQPRLGPVMASQRQGQLQVYNALQLFWYWGARRWTGVLNVRVTPLPSGDALLPVCEYVARTEMTECSIVIDDPVVYMHGFVVMLGRRTRAVEEMRRGHGTTAASSGAEMQCLLGLNQAGTRHSLEAAAAAPLANGATGTSAVITPVADAQPRSAERAGPPSTPSAPGAHMNGIHSRTDRSTGETPSSTSGSAGVTKTSPVSNAISSPTHMPPPPVSALRQPHSSSPTAHTASDSDNAQSAAPHDLAIPLEAASAVGSAGAAPLPEWLYWYQRCVLETTDEWLWNRAASEVAEDAARSTTPWWKPRHIKMGVGLSLRYRKPRGVNVYWGWSARVGRGTHFSGHIDVLRRMSCAVSSTFGFLDVSVRLRVNLVTLHQTALDAGVCWRPVPQVPEFAVRLATSANGATLGVEVADVAPTLYGPVVARLSRWRSRRHLEEAAVPNVKTAGCGEAGVASPMPSAAEPSVTAGQSSAISGSPRGVAEGSGEDLVGLLPVTWHYLQGAGSLITSTISSVTGVVMSRLVSASSASSATRCTGGAGNVGSISIAQGSVSDVRHPPAPLSATSTFTTPAMASTLPAEPQLSCIALPAGQASLRYARNAWHALADLGWLENMLRTSHVNVSMGVTSEPSNRHREWSLFLIINEK
ncbi:hypothetical protein LSCM1_05774 [Leishmania martiniquensis]|uniref:Uncharacterized protein n=1 Tax=Leishmania martiniquensis TaxID=1580590 RepID=A0A836KNN0_9TRYP|nr:hypothetical protein LSCM1_05774 [Leishmania martiniquensis]